jgi:hypothetical protein
MAAAGVVAATLPAGVDSRTGKHPFGSDEGGADTEEAGLLSEAHSYIQQEQVQVQEDSLPELKTLLNNNDR